jgi:Fe-S cluster biogenesis protein NfuA
VTFCVIFLNPSSFEINQGKNMSLTLTRDNVENVLDELRPYLMSDGGNVELVEIEGPIVRLRLQGACGSCPSSAMTLRMGIERKLKEEIPEIDEIEQVF